MSSFLGSRFLMIWDAWAREDGEVRWGDREFVLILIFFLGIKRTI